MRIEWRVGLFCGLGCWVGLLTACPGEIEDPDTFVGELDQEFCVEYTEQLLERQCSIGGCHDTASNAADLNLEASDLGAELIDVPGTDDCNNEPLISSFDPELSLMYTKMTNAPTCRARMPLFADAPEEFEVDCMLLWIEAQLPDLTTEE